MTTPDTSRESVERMAALCASVNRDLSQATTREVAPMLRALRDQLDAVELERDRQYEENVARIAAQAKAEAERDAALAGAERTRMTDMSKPYDGGPAFPTPWSAGTATEGGMTLRDWLAGNAPVTFEMAMLAYGGEPHLIPDADRAAFFAVWTMLRYEYADSMLTARETQ